ncbi:MAG: ABC transporter permease [Spirochaetales bacterium]|nr:ABC transporter permease [Spirochaetales bacterium]
MKGPLSALVRKEFIHILRDKQSLFMVLTMPLLMLLLYGYAINLEMKSIEITLSDESSGPASRELIRHLEGAGLFKVTVAAGGVNDRGALFRERAAQCILEIPRDYDTLIARGETAPLQLIIDAGDPNAAAFMENYVTAVVRTVTWESAPTLFTVEPRILYNRDMGSAPFFIPGLIALILLLICALLTSIAIVREKETGTMEQLLVSPIKAGQIIMAKVLPYTFLGFFDGLMILVVGSLLFKVPVQGSFILIMGMMLIYVVTGLSLGMLISTLASTQAVAMLAAIILTVLPSMLMSGFIFPISSMPPLFQRVSRIIPATYFLEIIRGIVLKGNNLSHLYRPAALLLGLDGILITLSIRSFRIRLE